MAGRFTVEAVFKAVDKVTGPVGRMQTRIGKMTRSVTRGLRTVNRGFTKLSQSLSTGIKAGTATAVVALGAVSVALNRVADDADALAKQSRRLDFPIEELQEWRFVAEQSGVSSKLLNKSLGAFTKRLGEAKGGIGPLVSGLKKINPGLLEQLNNTDSVAEAFDIYIKAIRNAETATEKAALANAAFSRSGLDLVNISKNSTKAIDDLRKEQRQNGVMTLAQAEAAEAYNDAMNSLKKTVAGFVQTVLIPLLPKLTETIKAFREWILANKDLVAGKIFEFFRGLVDNFQEIVTWVKRIGAAIGVFFAFGLVLKSLIAVLTLVNLVMALNPIGLIVLAVVALIAVWAALIALIAANWDQIKAFFLDIWDRVQEKITQFVQWIAGIATIIAQAWAPVGQFFSDLWGGIIRTFELAIAKITGVIDRVKGVVSNVAGFFGFGDQDEQAAQRGQGGPRVISPQERAAQSIEERRTTSTAEVTIKDETGRAELTGGKLGPGLNMQQAGAF